MSVSNALWWNFKLFEARLLNYPQEIIELHQRGLQAAIDYQRRKLAREREALDRTNPVA